MGQQDRLHGCYLLIVLSQPLSDDHKERIVQKVAKGKHKRTLHNGKDNKLILISVNKLSCKNVKSKMLLSLS